MNTIYARLSIQDREEISRGIWAGEKFCKIAKRINRPTSTVSREVWSNVKYSWCYRAERAEKGAQEKRRARRRLKKLETNAMLKDLNSTSNPTSISCCGNILM